MKTFRAIGLMSGTSMDGLDVADVTFELTRNGEWTFELHFAECYDFPAHLLKRLQTAFQSTGNELSKLNSDLGCFYAEKVNTFLDDFNVDKKEVDLIASHGQTIFHQPQKGYTLQIGNGPELAVHTGIPTVVDFRSMDVALGGNGAPLIPVADFLLFQRYADSFLNLGGFANVSYQDEEKTFSFDICPVNIVLNKLAKQLGKAYDDNGEMGRSGQINTQLLNALNALDYYRQSSPKSLGWEWVENEVLPLLDQEQDVKNTMRTWYEHVAIQIGHSLNGVTSNSVMVTGGGANNTFLIDRIRVHTDQITLVPEEDIINFKEAIGFAFLGVLKWQDQINVWASVTGARKDSSSGVIIKP